MPHKCSECGAIYENNQTEILKNGCERCNNQSWVYLEKNNTENESTEKTGKVQTKAEKEKQTKTDIVSERAFKINSNKEGDNFKKIKNRKRIQKKLAEQFEGVQFENGSFSINPTKIFENTEEEITFKFNEDNTYTAKNNHST